MKHFKTLLMAVFTIISASVFSQQDARTNPILLTQGNADVIYACPMHPKVTSNKPGQCSQCNMHLAVAVAAPFFACSTHPSVTSTEPVKCGHCGMDLVRSTKEKMNSMKKFACLMHTEVTSHQPGACIKCKLTLTENKSR